MKRLARLVAAGLLLSASPAHARAPGAGPLGRARAHLAGTPRLLGDPGGLRSRLEARGVSLQLFHQQLWAWKPRGGIERDGKTGDSASWDLFVRLDLEELAGWGDRVVFFQAKGQYDRHLNRSVGALSDPADDADFDDAVYVAQLWLEQGLLDGRVRLRAGFLQTQTIFGRNAFADSEDRLFLNAALDDDPLLPLPAGLGAALTVEPWPALSLTVGVADADNPHDRAGFGTCCDDADGLNGYLEAALRVRWPWREDGLPGTWRIGLFRDGRERAVFGRRDRRGRPERDRGHLGGYLSLDQWLWREREAREQGLGVFARVGYADRDVSPAEWFWSAGLHWLGALPRRDEDVLGLAVHQAIASPRLRDAVPGAFHRETGVELFYRVQLLPWLAVTPDLQYIVEPGADPTAGNAVVVQLRFRTSF